MATSPRAFVLRHTRLRLVPGLEEIRLHLADAVLPLWHAVQIETADPDAPLPFWAFAWAGGLAIGRYLREHPEAVAGRRVFDLASGSGLCAIAAMHAGASVVTGADIDRFAAAATALNARANGRRVAFARRDVLDEEVPDVDVVLAGAPVMRLSIPTTVCSCASKRSQRWLPRNPAAPVTRRRMPGGGRCCRT